MLPELLADTAGALRRVRGSATDARRRVATSERRRSSPTRSPARSDGHVPASGAVGLRGPGTASSRASRGPGSACCATTSAGTGGRAGSPARPYSHVRGSARGARCPRHRARTALVGCSMGGAVRDRRRVGRSRLASWALVAGRSRAERLRSARRGRGLVGARRTKPVEAAIEAGRWSEAEDLRLRDLGAARHRRPGRAPASARSPSTTSTRSTMDESGDRGARAAGRPRGWARSTCPPWS